MKMKALRKDNNTTITINWRKNRPKMTKWVAFSAILVFLCTFNKVISLECWMCRGGAASFDLCDAIKEVQGCPPDQTRCATFSYANTTGFRVYAKSCTYESYCTANNTFCKNIHQGGDQCRVQCCEPDQCNFQKGFAPTTPPTNADTTPTPIDTTISSAPTTTKPTTSSTPTSATKGLSTEGPSPVTKGVDGALSPYGDDNDEDCEWVNGVISTRASSLLVALAILSFVIV
ncbi:uncharacterized protein LOC116603578 isoform X1 [Nematostella vectensis]|uniref:uncharacterized protein LOC116603578 isoform X1 n=1 Tax=Nematostella vectensis TaxID=45351 RepID=UPI00207737CA|nr:uncharacterized protein LOC116603578 isoform X1 [Nematostella vectensis]XP_048580964.1 uncharacterized protein LOC116603578 isoform X1 [Nematostella vectensis]